MAFNPTQFKQKKKRAVNPDAPPRPNLMSHDKKIRETDQTIASLQHIISRQQDEIDRLKARYADMQQSITMLVNTIRRNR